MKILFVTPECAPWVKTGDLGEVSAALPKALSERGHDVKVLMPAYKSLQGLLDQGQVLADIVHANDWPTGLAPAYLSRLPDLPGEWLTMSGLEYWSQLSFMKGGLQFADAITTVSPNCAREIQQEPLGVGLQGVLRDHADRLHGILNGIDMAVWHPAVDTFIPQRYDVSTVQTGKQANKAALQTH